MTSLPPDHDAPIAVLDPPAPPAVTEASALPAASGGAAWPPGPRPSRVARFFRGKESDPVWVRPALLTLLAATAVLYLWDLGASGWGNSFYSAAVQAGTKSWKAFFFGSSDSSNFITVDKPPAFLWPMEISARIFGLNSWSMLAPQALEGVATVGLVYLSVRRWFSAQAALLGGAIVALTPVAALMFRYNNPDAMLALLLTAATYAMIRGLERAQTKWLVLAGAFVGFGFITKMMQAFLILPVMAVVYLLAAPTGGWRRVWQVCLMGVSVLVAAGWWVTAVALTPTADRPYVGGSQDNSILNLIFGYNGFGRLTGNEAGSVGGGNVGGAMWGPTGWTRLFNASFGNMMSWLLPGALVMGAVLLVITIRARRTDRERAGLLLWGGSLVAIGLTISMAQGIIHPYYLVALAPPLGGLVGIATMGLWERRATWPARVGLAAALAVTVAWSAVLLGRTSNWFPALRPFVIVAGSLGVVAILCLPYLRQAPKVAIGLVAALGFGAALAAPLFSTVATAATPHDGAIPAVTPTASGGFGGPGGGLPGGGGFAARGGRVPTGGFPGGGNFPGGANFPGGGNFPGAGTGPGNAGTNPFQGGASSSGRAGPQGGFGVPGGGGGGGFLNGSRSNAALDKLLQSNASRYTWAAATVSAENAAGYQLGSGEPVMAIGGFNGTDPAPTLSQFERYVAEGKIHYFIAAGGGFGGGGFGGGQGGGTSSAASQIPSWVEAHFTAKTVGGVTVYDLTTGAS
ncbi:MAG TPA: glycosyltransferase family 39 protein [Acidimicrobiales bacterium]|nr:glycosyltransferase family 39 protein [Acidimicrobiales bacterium]